jgi:hypothetical protein
MVMLRDTDVLVAMALGKHALQATPSAFLDEFAR